MSAGDKLTPEERQEVEEYCATRDDRIRPIDGETAKEARRRWVKEVAAREASFAERGLWDYLVEVARPNLIALEERQAKQQADWVAHPAFARLRAALEEKLDEDPDGEITYDLAWSQ